MAKNREISSRATGTFKKGVRIPRIYLASALALCAVGLASARDVAWQPQNGSTDISSQNNWNGNTRPGNGDYMMFGNGSLGGDYMVTIPAATTANPYRDYAGLLANGLNDGQKVTFDATGTSWLVMADPGVTWYGSVAFRVIAGDHIFNIEGLNAANANDNFGFSLTDGKICFKRDDVNGSRLVFESGTFNNAFSPDGTASPHKIVFFHSNSAPPGSVVELAGGAVTFDQMEIRGKSRDCEVLVSGGEHHVYDGLVINTGKGGTSTGADAVLHVSGGSLTVENNSFWLGRDAGDKAVLRVDGTGLFEIGSGASTTYFPDGATYSGLLSIGGHGQFLTRKGIMFGHNGGTGEILVEEDGTFQCTDWFPIGEANNCTLAITVKDRGQFLASNAGIVQGTGRKLHMTVEDSATAAIRCGDMANNATAEFALDLKDDAVLKIGDDSGNINFGNNSGGKIDFTMTGGSLERYSGGEANLVIFRGGPASTYTIAGGTITTKNMIIEGVQNDNVVARTSYTNTVRMTGGTVNVRTNGGGDGLDIRGNDRNAMFLLEDGELNVGANMVRIGHGGAGNGYHSVLRQTGGVMNLGATVNLCDSAADGEVELFGGVARVATIRGWNQCDVRGNSNKATLYGNGGTLVPWNDGLKFFYTMSGVYVGERGLTVDTKTYNNVSMVVKIENKDSAAGLFVKKGTGTLKVGLVETDGGARGDFVNRSLAGEQTYTRIDEGTLLLLDATDAVFGKNVTVKGGAALSIEGTPTTLTVDTITLGDGHGFAVLKLDAGDTVVVEAANGVTANCGAIDVPWKSTEGTHAVFTCKQGVQASELDKIAVHDGDATKDYAWTTAVDNDTGYTICSVIVAPKGTLTKTITYSSGTVTTNGTGKVSGIIAEETGTQSGELVLSSTASVSVDDNQTMTLNGPLVGTGAELMKTGSGKLVIDGSNPDFYGSFASGGGTFEVLSAAGFGTNPLNFPLVLSGGTLRYTGSEEVVFNAALRIAAGEKKQQVILDNEGDMTFKSTEYVQGGFIKTGVGTLTFDLPVGKFALGSNDSSEDIGANAGQVSLPANGDSPTSNNGLYGVTVLEGMVKVVGEGRDVTTLETRNRALLGGGYPAETAAKLVVENARVNWGSGSRTATFCHDVPADRPSPEICLTNAMLWIDSPLFGYYAFGNNATVKLSMKDSEYYGHYNSRVGSGTVGVMIDADNSQMHSDGQVGWAINAKTIQADFHGANAEFGSFDKTQTADNSNGGRFVAANNTTGSIQLREGARMKTTRGIVFNNSEIAVVFDGGTFEIVPHNTLLNTTSTWTNVQGGFTTQGSGLAVDICEGSTHAFNFPVKGTGGLVKTGAGTFALVSPRTEGEKLLQHTGGTVVSNGSFVVDGSLVADGAKSFAAAEGGVLDLNGTELAGATLSGAGVVTNGTLATATITYDETDVPTFSDVVFSGKATVDFGHTAVDPLDKAAARSGLVVAHYIGAVPAGLSIKAKGTGIPMALTKTRYENGDVVVTITRSGFSVIIK